MAPLRLLLYLALGATAAAPQQSYRPLSMDGGDRQGHIRFQTEATVPPRSDRGDDYAVYFADFGDRSPDRIVIPVSLGGEGLDRHGEQSWAVFPDRNGDPQDPASYNFSAVEAVLEAAATVTPAVAVRLAVPPSTPSGATNIVEAARRLAMRLNPSWAQGQGFGVREWRVCAGKASPENTRPDGPGDFPGDSTVAASIVDALQRLDPTLSVGHCLHGSSATSTVVPSETMGRGPHFYTWTFPEAGNDASGPAERARALRGQLNEKGSRAADLLVLSPSAAPEGSPQEDSDDNEVAARLAAALVYLQDSPAASVALDLWRGNAPAEAKRQAVLRAAAQLSESPQRLATRGGDTDGYAVLAGRSGDGRALQILIANYQPKAQRGSSQARTPSDSSNAATANPEPRSAADGSQGYELEVGNLPWGPADFGVYVYRIDGKSNLELAWSGGGRGGSFRLRRPLPPQAIELLVLQQEDRPVYDRLPRRRNRQP